MYVHLERAKQELRDLVELVLLPGTAAVLPWRRAFVLFKWLAKREWLYADPGQRALVQAQQRGWAPDPDQWLQHRKLTMLVDHADHYLARTRSDIWMDRHLEVTGEWPKGGQAGIALTFHWGAGMWALRSAARAGLKGHMLVAPIDGAQFAGRSVLHGYIKARTNSIAQSLKCPYIDVGGGMRPVLNTLRSNEQVFAVVDVPADQVAASQAIDIAGMSARIPTALLRVCR